MRPPSRQIAPAFCLECRHFYSEARPAASMLLRRAVAVPQSTKSVPRKRSRERPLLLCCSVSQSGFYGLRGTECLLSTLPSFLNEVGAEVKSI